MREFLKGLELDQETIDTIMAEYGKNITNFKEAVDSYKEEIEGYKNQINELNGTIETNNKSLEDLQNITNENKNLKAQLQMSDSNVKKEFSKFVINEVNSLVDEKTDFSTALENYKKENPQYFGETVVKKVQSSPSVGQGGTQAETTNDIMNNLLRGSAKE